MPAYSITRDQAVREIAEVERALDESYPPTTPKPGGEEKTAIGIAAERMAIGAQSLRGRVGKPGRNGSTFRKFGIAVDWSKYKPKPPPPAVH